MKTLSRREFGRLVSAVPLAGAVTAIGRIDGIEALAPIALGVSTSSFRDLPRVTGLDNLDAVLDAVRAVSVSDIELAFANLEPAPPATAPMMGGSAAYPRRIVLTPEEIAATNADARAALRRWRLETGAGFFEDVRGKLAGAGITVHGCALTFDASWTDEEIDAVFRQAKVLGVATISSPMTMATAERLVPFAERHRIAIAVHNQPDGNRHGQQDLIDTPRLDAALALSPTIKLKLDAGHLTASNGDAVAELRKCRGRVAYVVLRDRLRNGGASQPFGDGDTPLRGLLDALTDSPPVPALVEYDYLGLRSSVAEVTASLAYLRNAR